METKPKIIFALYGDEISYDFFMSWTALNLDLQSKGYFDYMVSYVKDTKESRARNLTLGGNTQGGPDQLPFSNSNFDFVFFLNTDVVFDAEQVYALILKAKSYNLDFISGVNFKNQELETNISLKAELNFSLPNKQLQYSSYEDVLNNSKTSNLSLAQADYCDLDFAAVSYRCFQRIKYPWFCDRMVSINNLTELLDCELNFCMALRAAGTIINVDPQVRIGKSRLFII